MSDPFEMIRDLYHYDPTARREAARALSQYALWEDRETLRPYISHFLIMLADEDLTLVETGAYILGELQAEEAVPHLLPLLRDSLHPAHEEAVTALKRIGRAAVPALRLLLKGDDPDLANRAVLILAAINTLEAQRAIAEWSLRRGQSAFHE